MEMWGQLYALASSPPPSKKTPVTISKPWSQFWLRCWKVNFLPVPGSEPWPSIVRLQFILTFLRCGLCVRKSTWKHRQAFEASRTKYWLLKQPEFLICLITSCNHKQKLTKRLQTTYRQEASSVMSMLKCHSRWKTNNWLTLTGKFCFQLS